MPLKNLSPLARKLTGFFAGDSAILREALKAVPPEEVAIILNNLGDHQRYQVLALLDDAKLSRVIWDLSPHARSHLIPRLGHDRILALMAHLESDEIVDLIQMLEGRRRERVIEALKKSDPKRILPLLGFEEETAGGLMKTELFRAEMGKTVEEVRKGIAASAAHRAADVYVTDAEGTLVGAVSMVRLVAAPPSATMAEVMRKKPLSVPASLSQEDVVRVFSEHEAVELPVVDAKGRLLGIITADDMIEVMQESLAEDLSRFSGTSEDEHISDPAWISIRRRLPWLTVNLATAVLAAWVVSRFQGTISQFVVLAALMPIVAGMGGNAVTQTLGVSIRAIALGELSVVETWKIAGRQALAGAANGLATGALMGILAYAWTRNHVLALVLVGSMTVNMLIAGLGGVLIPVTLKRLRIDPALASSVFATTLTDVVGFFTFLGMASLFLT